MKTVANKLAKYKFNLGTVQDIRWDKVGSQQIITGFWYGNRYADRHVGTKTSLV